MAPVFLKWAGGKRRIINEIEKELPEKIERYFEPFLGAGAVFFFIKEKYNPEYCLISDINKDLVDAYIAVRDNVVSLMRYLREYKKNNSEDFYYEVREKLNKNKIKGIKRAAAFIYINKTCFNGLYRVNSKNEFNVPYGHKDDVLLFDKDNLKKASQLLQGVEIKCQDYREIEKDVLSGNFVYLDPCYDPIKRTSFASYTPERFTKKNSEDLFTFIKSLTSKEVNVLLSNNDLKDIRDLYNLKNGFYATEVMVSRPINSVASDRGKIQELLIRNYKVLVTGLEQ
jgi:DNA adenine methylase